MVTLDSTPLPNPAVQGRRLENEAVLVLPGKGEVKVLNDVGATIWQLADGQRSVREIAGLICRQYQVTQVEAETDALDFIVELVAKGIVTLRS